MDEGGREREQQGTLTSRMNLTPDAFNLVASAWKSGTVRQTPKWGTGTSSLSAHGVGVRARGGHVRPRTHGVEVIRGAIGGVHKVAHDLVSKQAARHTDTDSNR